MLRVLSVHSNAIGDANSTDGHAWLNMHFANGRHVSAGLWTTSLGDLHRFVKDPTGLFDPDTYDMMATSTWRYSHTCASWAREVVRRVTGEDLESAGFGGLTDTPSALGCTIVKLEAKQPTSLAHPRLVLGSPVSSAFSGIGS